METTGKRAKRVCRAGVIAAAAVFLNASGPYAASEHGFASQYAGQEKREIKSLSAGDIRELQTGAGWGLAKAAELNGLPGPKHILEMKEQIALTADQEERITALYGEMNREAVRLGDMLIRYEKDLDNRFAERTIDEKSLDELLTLISETRKSLRYVHLAAHLKTPGILTDGQIGRYNTLRGYSSGDPCGNIPAGHDPVMWRRHNNCD